MKKNENLKKVYVHPETYIFEFKPEGMLCTSDKDDFTNANYGNETLEDYKGIW